MHLQNEILAHGGLAATYELLRAGATANQLTRAVRSGEVVRVRQGWYALPGPDDIARQSVRVGGRLTCVSGAAAHGLAVVWAPIPHVHVPRNASRLRERHDPRKRLDVATTREVRVHWGRGRRALGSNFVLLPRDCLRDMVFCQRPERVVAAADSALHTGKLTLRQWESDVAGLPRRLRRLLSRVDGRSESIIESIVRFRLEALGYHPQLQVRVPGVGRVDLLLGSRVVIELDGWEFHQTRAAFEEDRRRDAELAMRGYRVLRFTYRMVTRNWQFVLAAIRAIL
ncbi:hypothetical protein BH11ACT2_BH11ACT2_12010 [soil metagenome]